MTDSLRDMREPTKSSLSLQPHAIATTERKRHKRINRGRWTKEEDETLKTLVMAHGENSWSAIAAHFPDRSDMQCSTRWTKVLSPSLIKGQWTREEDELVVSLVAKYGAKKWTLIAKALKGRIGKQCRERYFMFPILNTL